MGSALAAYVRCDRCGFAAIDASRVYGALTRGVCLLCAPNRLQEVRKEHVVSEVAVRAIACFFWLLALLSGTSAYLISDARNADLLSIASSIGLCGACHHAAFNLWRLHSSGVASATLLCTLALLATIAASAIALFHRAGLLAMCGGAICALMPAYVLRFLSSKGARVVLSPEYARVIATTDRVWNRYVLADIPLFGILVVMWLFACVCLVALAFD
jgi:hypothetical protein